MSDEEWRALALPRPTPLPGAARISLAPVQLVGPLEWGTAAPVEAELGITELAIAGLLRRADVHFVERRRFTAAVEAERAGSRAAGAPAAGVSPGAEYVVTAVWLSLAPGQSTVETRLTAAGSGDIAGSARVPAPDGNDPVAVSRAVVEGVLAALERIGRLPDRQDPGDTPRGTSRRSRVSRAALASFLRGLAAEEAWNWEAARRGYQVAANEPGFPEAAAALARAARLRTGGTLGES